jgi:hypothetical protein
MYKLLDILGVDYLLVYFASIKIQDKYLVVGLRRWKIKRTNEHLQEEKCS